MSTVDSAPPSLSDALAGSVSDVRGKVVSIWGRMRPFCIRWSLIWMAVSAFAGMSPSIFTAFSTSQPHWVTVLLSAFVVLPLVAALIAVILSTAAVAIAVPVTMAGNLVRWVKMHYIDTDEWWHRYSQ